LAERKALVTGASGLVGSAIVNALLRDGWHVLYCSRRMPPAGNDVTWVPYDLAWSALPPDFGAGAEVLIHAALATGRQRNPLAANVGGTALLLDAARRSGINRRVFISSLAAGTDAPSNYAQQKRSVERYFESESDTVIRPGLVIGDGGLFKMLCRQIGRRAPVPLIDGGRQPVQTVLDDDLARVVVKAARERIAGTFSVGEPQPVEYRAFLQAIARALRVPIAFLSMPFWLADLGARAASALPLHLPVSREQLLGLRAMRPQPVTSDPRLLDAPVRPYDESIRLALSKSGAAW